MYRIIDGGICAPQGFIAKGLHVGLRHKKQADLGLIYTKYPAAAAGVFTLNQIKAAPVMVTQRHISNGSLNAIIVNSAIANSGTGELGMRHAELMTRETARLLNLSEELVAVASTGIIGLNLPIDKVLSGIHKLVHHPISSSKEAALAIMTIDTFPKSMAIELSLNGQKARIGGIAKGSSMVNPNMATLLGFITTDIAISPKMLKETLVEVTNLSFNMISVDGQTSTNDMVLALANGLAGNDLITSKKHPFWRLFCDGLAMVCDHLAKEIVRDGQGATKMMEVIVTGAFNEEQARTAVHAICNSTLVKTSLYAETIYIGPILSALGASAALINLKRLKIESGSIILFENGQSIELNQQKTQQTMKESFMIIKVDLGYGKAHAKGWGCDMNPESIAIKGSHRS